MKKNILFTTLLIITSLCLEAQTAPAIQWQKDLGSNGDDDAYSIKQTTDGGYIIAGHAGYNDGDVTVNYGMSDYWIVKLNSTGTIQWQKSYGGSGDDLATSINLTSDGGFIVAGASSSNDGNVTGNHGEYDYWILKLDQNGAILWQKTLGGSGLELCKSIEQTADGGFILAGFSNSDDGDVTGNHLSVDYWVVKLDNSGNIQWQKSLGGSNEDYANSVEQTSDGGFIVAGYSFSIDGDVSGNHGNEDYWIVKLDSNGGIIWQKSFGGSNTDIANSIEQTTDGGYIVAGYSSSNDGDVTGNHGSNDYWIVKLNNTGGLQWQKSLGGSGDDQPSSIEQTSDGGYIVSGYSTSNDGDASGNHGNQDYWVIKLNNSGTLQWQKSLGGSFTDVATSIRETSDHGYIMAGYSESADGDVTNHYTADDYWIVKLEPDAILPVTDLDFSGEVHGQQNLLQWITTSEHNNSGFEIQRSIDGTHFSKIDFINSKAIDGNSNTKLNYKYADVGYSIAYNYYRLKQIDKDGKFSYTNIIELKNDDIPSAHLAIIYPNPVKNILGVKIASPINNQLTFLITDVSGKILQTKIINTRNGETIEQFNISNLPAGIYILKMLSLVDKMVTQEKFVKQ